MKRAAVKSSLRFPTDTVKNTVVYRVLQATISLYYHQTFLFSAHHCRGPMRVVGGQVGRRIKSMSERSDLIEMPVPRLVCPIFTPTGSMSVYAASSRILAGRNGSTASSERPSTALSITAHCRRRSNVVYMLASATTRVRQILITVNRAAVERSLV